MANPVQRDPFRRSGASYIQMRMLPLLALLLACGCAAADRESYSLAFAKKSHQYADAWARRPADACPASSSPDPLKEYVALAGTVGLQPFRPFAYCLLHETDHAAESVLAVATAPVEYPVVLAVNTTSVLVQSSVQAVAELIAWLLPLPGLRELPERNKDSSR